MPENGDIDDRVSPAGIASAGCEGYKVELPLFFLLSSRLHLPLNHHHQHLLLLLLLLVLQTTHHQHLIQHGSP